jgi:hypothetical protein
MLIRTLHDTIDAKPHFPEWQPIETAPKANLRLSDGHRHGKRIVAYEPTSACILTCHWWETESGDASNYLDDGGRAVFPSKWIDIAPPEESDG